jgi:methyl-accepting chemotaxis protein
MISNQQNMPIEKEAKLLSVGVALDAVTYANPDLQPVEFLLK